MNWSGSHLYPESIFSKGQSPRCHVSKFLSMPPVIPLLVLITHVPAASCGPSPVSLPQHWSFLAWNLFIFMYEWFKNIKHHWNIWYIKYTLWNEAILTYPIQWVGCKLTDFDHRRIFKTSQLEALGGLLGRIVKENTLRNECGLSGDKRPWSWVYFCDLGVSLWL